MRHVLDSSARPRDRTEGRDSGVGSVTDYALNIVLDSGLRSDTIDGQTVIKFLEKGRST
jgi:hypothetical protein